MPARITRTSKFSGVTRTLEIKQYTQEEFDRRYAAWHRRDVLIQEAFPEISDSAREFIMTGTTDEEWAEMWGKDDDEYDKDNFGEVAF